MMKRVVGVLLLTIAVLIAGNVVLIAQDIGQPAIISYNPGVASWLPAFPGQMVRVNGNNFAMGETYGNYNNVYAEVVFVTDGGEVTLQSYIESPFRLYFLVPVEAPCGEQRFYIKNGADLPESDSSPSPTRLIFIDCDEANLGPQSARPVIDSISPELARPGDELTLRGSGFTFSSVVHFNREIIEDVTWISVNEVKFTIPADSICGIQHTVRFENRILHFPSQNSNFPANSSQIFMTVACGTSSRSTDRTVRDVDLDRNCLLSDDEFFRAVDAWVDGVILDTLLFASIDAWIAQANLCEQLTPLSQRLAAQHVDVNALRVRNAIYFSPQDPTQSVQIEIFNIQGAPVYSTFSTGRGTLWRFQNFNGDRVSNGIYWYRATSQDRFGQILTSAWKKLIVLR